MTNQKLKNSLIRYFDRIKDNRNADNYFIAVIEYHHFIAGNPALKLVISKLITQGQISPIEMQELFNDFMFGQTILRIDPKPITLKFPLFYNARVEKTFGLLRKFLELHGIKDGFQKGDRITLDPNARVVYPKKDKDFYHIQKLHDDIIEELEDETSAEKPKNSPKFPYKIPAGTKWGNFAIKFFDEENVLVLVKGIKHQTDFSEMGFADSRNRKCNKQWALLYALAKNNGELTWKDVQATDKNKKRKQLLTEQLQSYFRMDTDPFYPYADGKSYKTKMTLMVEQQNLLDKVLKENIMEGSPFN